MLTDEFNIKEHKCECPRGLAICHHLAALLFKCHYDISSTDTLCKWKAQKPPPDEIITHKELNGIETKTFPLKNRVTEADKEEFFQQISNGPPCGFSWILKPENHSVDQILPNIEAILHSVEYKSAINKKTFLMNVRTKCYC